MGQFTPTFYLFSRPSFIEGMSRVLDLGATLQDYNKSHTSVEADYIAISNDWKAIGKDIKASLQNYVQRET